MNVGEHADPAESTRRRRPARHVLASAVLAGCTSIGGCATAGDAPAGSTTGASEVRSQTASVAPYVLDGVLHEGSRQVKLPTADVVGFETLDGGGAILSVLGGPVPNTNLIVDSRGTVLRTLTDVGWVVSGDHTHILTGDGKRLVVLDSSGREVASRDDSRSPVAMVGDLAYAAEFLYSPKKRPSVEWDTRDGSTRDLPSNLSVVSADARLGVSVSPGAKPGSLCHQVFTFTDASVRPLRKVCGAVNGVAFVPESMSSDGTYLVGHNDAVKSASPVVVVVRTTDGSVVLGGRDDTELRGWGAAMPTETTLVLSRSTPDANRLESCSLAGMCAPLTSGLPNDIGSPRYVLSDP